MTGCGVPSNSLARRERQVSGGHRAVDEHPGEESVGHLRDHGAPRAILAREAVVVDRLQAMQMVRHQPKERRRNVCVARA